MQVANAPCSWGLPDPEVQGEMVGYGQMLDELAETGYTGTELGDVGYMPDDPAKSSFATTPTSSQPAAGAGAKARKALRATTQPPS